MMSLSAKMVVGQVRSVLREARGKGEDRFLVGEFNFELERMSSWVSTGRFAED